MRHLWIPAAALLALFGVLFGRATSETAPLPPSAAQVVASGAEVPVERGIPAGTQTSSDPVPAAGSRPSTPGAALMARAAETPAAEPASDVAAPARPGVAELKPQDARPFDRNHPLIAKAIEVQERHASLLDHPAVLGTAVGLDDDKRPVIVVYTRVADAGLPAALEGVPLRFEQQDEFRARPQAPVRTRDDVAPRAGETKNSQRWERPVPIGVSTGHPDITAGTIGCRVKKPDGTVYALSNNHVYANENLAAIGDAVIQPGTYDGGKDPNPVDGTIEDVIGTLSEYEPIVFDGGTNQMDAAIALSTTADLGYRTPHTGGYGVPSTSVVEPTIGMNVAKVGRTTGYTRGRVDAINGIVNVGYDTGVAKFTGQIFIKPGTFSAGGDSGSLIVTDDAQNRPVGLLFAGSRSTTIGNPIGPVLARFGVTIDDGAGAPPPPPPANAAPTVTITSPAPGASFESGASISFSGTASDEGADVSGSLVWRNGDVQIGTGASFSAILGDGTHTITASATDAGGLTGAASVTITVAPASPPPSGTLSLAPVAYSAYGGKTSDRHLVIAVSLQGEPLSGVAISIELANGPTKYTGTASTVNGTATFELKNAPSGSYSTKVTAVDAGGLDWDGVQPTDPGFVK